MSNVIRNNFTKFEIIFLNLKISGARIVKKQFENIKKEGGAIFGIVKEKVSETHLRFFSMKQTNFVLIHIFYENIPFTILSVITQKKHIIEIHCLHL